MGYVAKIVYDKDNRVTEENDAHGKIKEMRNRMRKIVAATEENKEEIIALTQQLMEIQKKRRN